MADTKISALTNYTTPLAADIIPIVDTANTTTKGVTVPNLLKTANLPNGLNNGTQSAVQSQVVVSATNYYITNSNLALPNPTMAGMAVGSRYVWRVYLTKTAAGTGVFQMSIYRGTNGSTSDTQDVLQTIGTQTAAIDNMQVDVMVTVVTTGASGSYFWTMVPRHDAARIVGFGLDQAAVVSLSGTVSAVAMNTAGLTFGLGFKATTGTPTITVPFVTGNVFNLS